MPQGDRTGPEGQGPMTGRAMGSCAGFNIPVFARGFGRGRGIGRRARNRQIQQVQPVVIEKQEKQFLEQELDDLKEEMKEVERRLKEVKE